MFFLFLLPFLIVLGSPFPLLVLFFYTRLRRGAPRLLNPIRIASLAILIACLGLFFSGWRFKKDEINVICGLLAIGSYCFLASSASEIPSRPLRVAALLSLGAPACFVTLLVVLAPLFEETPYKAEQMRFELVCKESTYGVVSAGGERNDLYQSWPGLPFIEKRII